MHYLTANVKEKFHHFHEKGDYFFDNCCWFPFMFIDFRWCLLISAESHVTFFVELAFGSIERTPKTVELRSIQNGNYYNLRDFRTIIAILCGALVSNTWHVFCRGQSSHVLNLPIYQKLTAWASQNHGSFVLTGWISDDFLQASDWKNTWVR